MVRKLFLCDPFPFSPCGLNTPTCSLYLKKDVGILDRLLGPPGKTNFAQLLITALKKAGDAREIRYEESHFRLVFFSKGEDSGVLNLSNLYHEYCAADKSDREARIREMVRAALSHLKEIPADFSDASHDIRPRLWTRGTFERLKLNQQFRRQQGGDGQNDADKLDWPLEPVGEHLYLSLVYDLPESVRSISNDDLEQWGVTYREAREVALQNLRTTELAYTSVGKELYVSATGDSYDATRLVLTALFGGLEIEGNPVAMVPNRDTLIVTGSESITGQRMMLEFAARQLSEQPRPMTAMPLILDYDGTWEDWEIPAEHPLSEEFRRLRIMWMASEYGDQKQLLDTIHKALGDDTQVAKCMVGERDKRAESFCLWSPSSDLQIPLTERILFSREADHGIFASAAFADVLEHTPHLLERIESYPVLFRATRQPNVEELKFLGAELIDSS